MSDQRGIYNKFSVRRTDGKDAPGLKHDGCAYFVLDVNHDPFALQALRAYAKACKTERPTLARDIEHMLTDFDGPAHCLSVKLELDRELNPPAPQSPHPRPRA